MSAAGKGELSKTQSRSRLRLGDIKTLNSPDGNWLRRRNSIPRRIPASRSFVPISLLPFGMERHYRERRVNNHQILTAQNTRALESRVFSDCLRLRNVDVSTRALIKRRDRKEKSTLFRS